MRKYVRRLCHPSICIASTTLLSKQCPVRSSCGWTSLCSTQRSQHPQTKYAPITLAVTCEITVRPSLLAQDDWSSTGDECLVIVLPSRTYQRPCRIFAIAERDRRRYAHFGFGTEARRFRLGGNHSLFLVLTRQAESFADA